MQKKILVLAILIIYLCGFTTSELKTTKTETFKDLHLSIKCNSNWKQPKAPTPLAYNYTNMLMGSDGYVEPGYVELNSSIDDYIRDTIVNSPSGGLYGKKPLIVSLKIQGQDARLVFPSIDQEPQFNNRAIIYIKYPSFIDIQAYNNLDGAYNSPSTYTYNYAYITADKFHIIQIYKTLKFIK